MKFFYALVMLTAFLLTVNGKKEEEEANDMIKRRDKTGAATPFYFEQLLAYYLNLFQIQMRL
jgi:hypothetical protein